ncbi:MAG: T9SS type A sorting domain-containing protein, partial [Candidatus Krumholzibacteria bacterium]|nr:T9SS type A sorting domain-containing protein [Candidatus Krumholzibacteria bacterium]
PTDDGRIKPDLVADGIDVVSTFPGNSAYDTLSGTSMATPAVSGSLNLIARLFEAQHGKQPLSSTLKALAIAGTDEAGPYDGPDYVHGWGIMNTLRSAEIANASEFADKGVGETTLSNYDVHSYYFTVPTPGDVRVTIAWTDPPGTPPSPSLDPATPMLVNDLDLRVQRVGSTQYLPWKLNRLLPAFAATKADNTVDNVEQVDIANAPAGTYVVRVSHKGTLAAPQLYSLVWQGLQPTQPEAIGLITDGADIELRPLDTAIRESSSEGNQERGAFVAMVRDFNIQSVGIKLALTCPTDITASVYEADGMTRGALVTSSTISNAYHPGEVFYYVPLPVALNECEDYEIVFQFGNVRHWWSWLDSQITLPFQRAGVINVIGGSSAGGTASASLPHIDVVGSAPAPGATADLTPPATAWSTCGDSSTKRGVYVKAEKTIFVHSVTWRASYPAFSNVELRANIYDAIGTTRVSLIATGVSHPGILSSAMQDFEIPVSTILREGRNYDIELVFTAGTWECKSEGLFSLPFTVGAIRTLDGESNGNASNSIMPHIKVAWSDGPGGTVVDLEKPSDPSVYATSQPGYDRGAYVTAQVDKQLFSLGWLADIPEGETIGARVFEATGTTRGALIAAGSITSANPGERWHDIPVSASLLAGQDYDLEIEINGVNSYKYWLEYTGMPFTAGGIQVRDGETGGDASNLALVHLRVNTCGLTPTGVGDGPTIAPPFALREPYPNPVSGMARIGYSLDRDETVSVALYDVRGRRVATLLDSARRPAGTWQLDLPTRGLPAGVYFVKLSSASRSVSRKIVVVR